MNKDRYSARKWGYTAWIDEVETTSVVKRPSQSRRREVGWRADERKGRALSDRVEEKKGENILRLRRDRGVGGTAATAENETSEAT